MIPKATILALADLTIATVVPPRAEEVATPTPEAATEVAEHLIRKSLRGEDHQRLVREAMARIGAA